MRSVNPAPINPQPTEQERCRIGDTSFVFLDSAPWEWMPRIGQMPPSHGLSVSWGRMGTGIAGMGVFGVQREYRNIWRNR